MRIIGYIEHPTLKITAFKMDTRLSVKFELGFLEQTYKFTQQEGLEGLSHLKKLVDNKFIKDVEQNFKQMLLQHQSTLSRNLAPNLDDEFDDII